MCQIERIVMDDETFERLIEGDSFDYWEVSQEGDISAKEAFGAEYEIPANRLTEQDWIFHIFRKGFPHDGEKICKEFYFAFVKALRNAHIDTLTVDINGIHAVRNNQ